MTPVGVLFCNLGTPDAPTPAAVRRYLREFLWDRRVVQIPRPLWWLILNGVVLTTRPRKVAHAYAQVWMDGGSPLRVISGRQVLELAHAFERSHPGRVRVELAMRYGAPSIADGLRRLTDAGVERVLVLPAYPQFSSSTTASVFDAVSAHYERAFEMPGLRFIRDYHDDDAYIESLAASIRDHWEIHGRSERLLMSFHGVPKRFSRSGDPYERQCRETARRLASALDLGQDEWLLTFQSRFGREPWLEPYTDMTLTRLGGEGVRKVDVVCPGFAADCLETLEEIAMQNRDTFVEAGGESLRYIPALNDRADHVAMLHALAVRNLQGWL